MNRYTKRILITLNLLIIALPLTTLGETLLGSTVESRVALAFKVNEQAAQAMLPEGWKLLTLPKGPLAGANTLVAFIDKHLAVDADGKPLTPFSSRTVALVNYGVKKGVKGARTFISLVYETPPVVDPYGNSISASISRHSSLNGPSEPPKIGREEWTVVPETGGEIKLTLSYQAGRPSWKPATTTPYSNLKPDFYRIYKYQQLADLAMSKAMKLELKGDVSFESSAPELAEMFDGSENLVGILAIPVYTREVFLP